jgi:hypothetical protein
MTETKTSTHVFEHMLQLVAKKSGNDNVPNVNLILSVCQLTVLDKTYQIILKNVIEF